LICVSGAYGFQGKYTYKSVVYHIGGATLNEGNPKKTYLNFRNSLLAKEFTKINCFSVVFMRNGLGHLVAGSIYFLRKI
jgi:hypothetical protein